jgi:hypothetical protein
MGKALLAILFIIGMLFVGCLLSTVIGALAGFIVGLAFDGSLQLLAQAIGIPEAQPYQLGAILGFVGGFFRSSISKG